MKADRSAMITEVGHARLPRLIGESNQTYARLIVSKGSAGRSARPAHYLALIRGNGEAPVDRYRSEHIAFTLDPAASKSSTNSDKNTGP